MVTAHLTKANVAGFDRCSKPFVFHRSILAPWTGLEPARISCLKDRPLDHFALHGFYGDNKRIRTAVPGMRTQNPKPLDDTVAKTKAPVIWPGASTTLELVPGFTYNLPLPATVDPRLSLGSTRYENCCSQFGLYRSLQVRVKYKMVSAERFKLSITSFGG
jgi:hypothetical protein